MNARELYDRIKDNHEQRAFILLESYARNFPAAENGATAFYLGLCFYKGLATAPSFEKAFKLFMEADTHHFLDAIRWVGFCYEAGKGVNKDIDKAVHWYKRYAEAVPDDRSENSAKSRLERLLKSNPDNAAVLHGLGLLHYYGRCCDSDISTARSYFERAARLGHGLSKSNMGSMYEIPEDARLVGISVNLVEAAKWYLEAAKTPATEYDKGSQYGSKYLNDLAAKEGADPAIIVMQGEMYENGWGVPQDFARAKGCYERAAAKKYDVAMVKIAGLYRDGRGVDKDLTTACLWYYDAAQLNTQNEGGSKFAFNQMREISKQLPNYPLLLNNIGDCHLRGFGTPVNVLNAFDIFKRMAEECHDAAAMFNLAEWFFNIKRDNKEAVRWMYKAAVARGQSDTAPFEKLKAYSTALAPADFEIGACYFRGLGTEVSYNAARDKFTSLPKDERALFYLGMINEDERNLVAAAEMYYKSAKINGTREEGSKDAARRLAAMAIRVLPALTAEEGGEEVARRLEAMVRWAPLELTAVHAIGLCYKDGYGVKKHREMAAFYFTMEVKTLFKELTSHPEAKVIPQKIKRILSLNMLIFTNDLHAMNEKREALLKLAPLAPEQQNELSAIEKLQSIQRQILEFSNKIQPEEWLKKLEHDNSPYASRIRDYQEQEQKIQYCIEQRKKCLQALRDAIAAKKGNKDWKRTILFWDKEVLPAGVAEMEPVLAKLDQFPTAIGLMSLYMQIAEILEKKEKGSERLFYASWLAIFNSMSFDADFNRVCDKPCGMRTTTSGRLITKMREESGLSRICQPAAAPSASQSAQPQPAAPVAEGGTLVLLPLPPSPSAELSPDVPTSFPEPSAPPLEPHEAALYGIAGV